MHVYDCVYISGNVCTWMPMKSTVLLVDFLCHSIPYFWDKVSMKPGAPQLVSLTCQQAPRTSCSVSLAPGLQTHSIRLGFQTFSEDPNSGASVCWSGTLSTESLYRALHTGLIFIMRAEVISYSSINWPV